MHTPRGFIILISLAFACSGLACQGTSLDLTGGSDEPTVDGDAESAAASDADGDKESEPVLDGDSEAESDLSCTDGQTRCNADYAVEICASGAWAVSDPCMCGNCVGGKCIGYTCSYVFKGCDDDHTVRTGASDASCCPDQTKACANDQVCSVTAQGCASTADGDTDSDTTPDGDTDADTGDTDSEADSESAASEICDMIDNNGNGQTDEGSACSDPNLGLRVELAWNLPSADLNLHVLRPGGDFGRPEEIDDNDCFPSNPHPDWGVVGQIADNPQFNKDVTSGSFQYTNPETVHLPLPADEPLRVLVHYNNSSDSIGVIQRTSVRVRVYGNGQLLQTFTATLPSTGSYWNVACISPRTPSATAIQNSDGSQQIATGGGRAGIDIDACSGGSTTTCTSACDCTQGQACVQGICQAPTASDEAAYCCDQSGCAAGQLCEGANGEAYCGLVATFDTDPSGQAIASRADVGLTYESIGVIFTTSLTGSYISSTTRQPFTSNSGADTAATRSTSSTTVIGRGDITADLVVPGSDEVAQTTYVGMFIGEISTSAGITITAYDADGQSVATKSVTSAGWQEIQSDTPFVRVSMTPGTNGAFAIDDFTTGDLSSAGVVNGRF